MSTIYQIQTLLVKTIADKEAYRDKLMASEDLNVANSVMCEMLRININELKVILHDVNKACEEYSLLGWQVNPERMGQ